MAKKKASIARGRELPGVADDKSLVPKPAQPKIVRDFEAITFQEAMAIDVVALMQRLRNAAAEVSEAIAFWRLEGATHIRRFRATARAAAHLVEWKEHYLSQRLLDVPMTRDVFERFCPCVKLEPEDHSLFAAAIDLLEDAVGDIFSGAVRDNDFETVFRKI